MDLKEHEVRAVSCRRIHGWSCLASRSFFYEHVLSVGLTLEEGLDSPSFFSNIGSTTNETKPDGQLLLKPELMIDKTPAPTASSHLSPPVGRGGCGEHYFFLECYPVSPPFHSDACHFALIFGPVLGGTILHRPSCTGGANDKTFSGDSRAVTRFWSARTYTFQSNH